MNKRYRLIMAVLASGMLAGCNGGGEDSGSDGSNNGGGTTTGQTCVDGASGVKTCTLDATAYDKYVYFSLKTGAIVSITDAQAETSDAWDIAFRRFAIKTNGGSSGIGNHGAALVVAQDDFYNADGSPKQSVFANATADGELDHLTGSLTVPATWTVDILTSLLAPAPVNDASNCTPISPPAYRINYGWYIYHGGCLPTPHALSANTNTGWLLKSAEGTSYSRFRATSVSFSNTNGLSATFEFTVQPPNTTSFSVSHQWQITNLASGDRCYDFDAGAEIACTGSIWDVRLSVAGQSIELATNSGPNGPGAAGALGPEDWTTVSGYQNGTTAIGGAPYTADANSSLLDVQSWYAYNITGSDHKLWPNYRVYMVNTDTSSSTSALFAMQVINYYKDTGASGYMKFRFRPVTR